MDNEFREDSLGGHCDGLKKAFTPRASFVCCELATNNSEVATTETLAPSTEVPPTTTIIYEERTEISVEESITLLAGGGHECGLGKVKITRGF